MVILSSLLIGCARKNQALPTTHAPISDLDSGLHLLKQKLYIQALPYLKSAVLSNPNSAISHSALGWTYYKMGHVSAAITAAETVLFLEPNRPDLTFLIQHLRQNQPLE